MPELHDHSGEGYLGVELRLPLDGISPDQLQAALDTFVAFSGGQVMRSFAVTPSPVETPEKAGKEVDLFSLEVQAQLNMSVEELFSEDGAESRRKRRECLNNVLRGGARTVRDVLLSGASYFYPSENKGLRMGPVAMDMLRAALQEKCPYIPFRDYVLPQEMARFCRSLDEVPLPALRMWDFSAEKGVQSRPLPYDMVDEHQSVGELLRAVRAGQLLTFKQVFVSRSCELDWYEQCFREPDTPASLPLA